MKLRIADFFVILAVLCLAFGIWLYPLFSAEGDSATISQNGSSRTVSLANDAEIELDHASVLVSDGKICIARADCPDQVCVETGTISRAGESIVCVPNKITITIDGKSTIDAVVN